MAANFTCRNREMLLQPDEAELALRGSIAPSLRARSAHYYWRTSEQAQARREALCTKQSGWHLRIFGSHSTWAMAAEEKCGSQTGVARFRARGELNSCIARRLDDLPASWRLNAGVNNATRGAGWWRWKPYYLLRELQAVPHGDVLVHTDYDLQLSKHPSGLWCLGQNEPRGIVTFHFPCLTDRAWTKAEVATALGASPAMLDTSTLYAGLLVLRRTPAAEAFLQEWLGLTLRGELATDALAPGVVQDPTFVEHRHDQSLLSLLAKRRGIKSFPLPTQASMLRTAPRQPRPTAPIEQLGSLRWPQQPAPGRPKDEDFLLSTTRQGHDVRDVWAWEAGYCAPGFKWALPTFRPNYAGESHPK